MEIRIKTTDRSYEADIPIAWQNPILSFKVGRISRKGRGSMRKGRQRLGVKRNFLRRKKVFSFQSRGIVSNDVKGS